MEFGGVRDPGSYDRRRRNRIKLSVPVQFGKGASGKGEVLYFSSGQSADLSTSGVYFRTREPGPFAPGEVLAVSIPIPWELRRMFPFSRIVGSGRIIRIEEQAAAGQDGHRGVALEFNPSGTTLLGAIVTS